jgi:hypothetical protein
MLRLGRSAVPSRTPAERLNEFVRQIPHDQLTHGLSSTRINDAINDIVLASVRKDRLG